MDNIIQFGIELIDLLNKDERFSFGEGDLRLYADGLTADDSELANFIADANKVYHNSADEELHGNYLICECDLGSNTGIKKQLRFDLDAYYKSAKKTNIFTVKENIAKELLDHSADTEIDDALNTNEYEKLRSRLMIRMLNFPKNHVRLEDAVYDRFVDMAICAYMKISNDDGQFMSSKITKDMLTKYDISAEQLMKDAVSNSAEIYPERLFFNPKEAYDRNNEGYSADEALRLVKSGEKTVAKSTLILTNTIHLNGASALFYPGVAEKISEILGGDYYAVCLSIHEIWLHGRESVSPRLVKDSLYQNNVRFNDGDMLTNYVYRYDVRRKQFRELK